MTIYQNNIPQPNDLISESQSDLQGNYRAFNEIHNVDHILLTATENNGRHKKTTYKALMAAPATAADEMAIYSIDNGNGRISLKARYQSNGPVLDVAPFSAARFGLVGGGGVSFLNKGLNVNVDQVATTWDGAAVVTYHFTTDAADTNYYVFVYKDFPAAGTGSSTPTVVNKAVGQFEIRSPAPSTFNPQTTFNVMVYEQ